MPIPVSLFHGTRSSVMTRSVGKPQRKGGLTPRTRAAKSVLHARRNYETSAEDDAHLLVMQIAEEESEREDAIVREASATSLFLGLLTSKQLTQRGNTVATLERCSVPCTEEARFPCVFGTRGTTLKTPRVGSLSATVLFPKARAFVCAPRIDVVV